MSLHGQAVGRALRKGGGDSGKAPRVDVLARRAVLARIGGAP